MKLRTQTPEALRELHEQITECRRQQAIQAKRADRKSQADALIPHFRLTPNDEPQRRLF